MAYVDIIKKFVEEDYKNCTILVTCDNEHKFWHRASSCPDLVWDWENERFMALEPTDEIVDQNQHPMMITTVELAHIQFLTAYVDRIDIINFINENYTDEEAQQKALKMLKKTATATMGPNTLRKNLSDPEYRG